MKTATLKDPYVGKSSVARAAVLDTGAPVWQWGEDYPGLIARGLVRGPSGTYEAPIDFPAVEIGSEGGRSWTLCEPTESHLALLVEWARRNDYLCSWKIVDGIAVPR